MPILRHALWIAPALVAMSLVGCRFVEKTARMPVEAVTGLLPGTESTQPDLAALQVELQRYADDFIGRTAAALDEYARRVATPDARSEALGWKLVLGSSAIGIASSPNPTANLLDFLGLTTLMRIVLEEHWLKTAHGPAFQPWLDASRTLEANAWKLAEGILKPEQQQELRDAIRQWREENPKVHSTVLARPREFVEVIRGGGGKTQMPGSVFSVVGLDPTAGLDPAVREVTRTRLFAERAMFTAQRMPLLLRWHIELLADQLLHGPEVTTALTNAARLAESADRVSRAAESASQTAAQLPDRITAERKAILAALETQEGRLRDLSVEIERTLAAGENMSASLNTTITAFDALMKRFGVGDPATNAAPDTNSPPFNILDYARTAGQIATMAKELDGLIQNAGSTLDSPALNQRLRELGAIAERAKADAKSVLNHAFLLGAGLVLLTFACALAYRRLTPRGTKARSDAVGLAKPDAD
jgi:hypothetical protein